MVRRVGLAVSGAIVAVPLLACLVNAGNVRPVMRDQAGGELSLEGNQEEAMQKAHEAMAAHCGPGNYTVVREGEVVVGEQTNAGSNTDYGESHGYGGSQGSASTNSSSVTTAVTEYHIWYQCGGAAPAVAAPMPAAPPPGPAPAAVPTAAPADPGMAPAGQPTAQPVVQ